jgi:hypothetical protein
LWISVLPSANSVPGEDVGGTGVGCYEPSDDFSKHCEPSCEAIDRDTLVVAVEPIQEWFAGPAYNRAEPVRRDVQCVGVSRVRAKWREHMDRDGAIIGLSQDFVDSRQKWVIWRLLNRIAGGEDLESAVVLQVAKSFPKLAA